MTTKQLEKIYATVCATKGFTPNTAQFTVWKQTLLWFEAPDLEQAVADWFGANTAFPMPADLKPLIVHAKNAREAKIREPEFYMLWECADCGGTVGIWNSEMPPKFCRGNTRVPLNHPDYGKICTGQYFNLAQRLLPEKKTAAQPAR